MVPLSPLGLTKFMSVLIFTSTLSLSLFLSSFLAVAYCLNESIFSDSDWLRILNYTKNQIPTARRFQQFSSQLHYYTARAYGKFLLQTHSYFFLSLRQLSSTFKSRIFRHASHTSNFLHHSSHYARLDLFSRWSDKMINTKKDGTVCVRLSSPNRGALFW